MSLAQTAIIEKSKLKPEQLVILTSEVEKRKPSAAVAYLLWLFLGGIGAHRFYLKQPGRAIAMICTLGGLGIWALIDVFFIGKCIQQLTEEAEVEVISQIRALSI